MYTYNDMPDKTADGILKEVAQGIPKIAVWFQTTQGIPWEMFRDDMVEKHLVTNVDKLNFYMSFRNKHPEVFNDNNK